MPNRIYELLKTMTWFLPNGIYELWETMTWFPQVTVLVVISLLVQACVLFGNRLFRYQIAYRNARPILRLLQQSAGEVELTEITATARHCATNPVARVVLAGIRAFQAGLTQLPGMEAVTSADRAMRRCEATVHAEMKTGQRTLASIAAVAPFFGLLATLAGILDAFPGGSNTPTGWLVLTSSRIAAALFPTALALAVGVLAIWFYNRLASSLERLDADAAEASLRLAPHLNAHLRDARALNTDAQSGAVKWGPGAQEREVHYDRQRWLFFIMWLLSAYVLFIVIEGLYALYWYAHH